MSAQCPYIAAKEYFNNNDKQIDEMDLPKLYIKYITNP